MRKGPWGQGPGTKAGTKLDSSQGPTGPRTPPCQGQAKSGIKALLHLHKLLESPQQKLNAPTHNKPKRRKLFIGTNRVQRYILDSTSAQSCCYKALNCPSNRPIPPQKSPPPTFDCVTPQMGDNRSRLGALNCSLAARCCQQPSNGFVRPRLPHHVHLRRLHT